MNNKILALFLCASLIAPSFVRAENDDYAPYLNPSSRQSDSSITREPVLGRIFGVQGSGADIKHYVFDVSNRTPRHAALRSALVPGWGQRFNNEKGKAILFFATTVGMAAGSLMRYSDSRHTYNDYKKSGSRNGVLFDDYEDERTQALAMGAAALVLYTFGIIDAHRRAYAPLYSSDRSVTLALSGSESQLVWSRKF